MKLYKLMNNDRTTSGNQKWEIDVTVEKEQVSNPMLCSPDVLHAYRNINLAYMLNPIHGNFKDPILAECYGKICVEDWGKVGCFSLTPVRWLVAPEWVGSNRDLRVQVNFAVLCAEAVLPIFEGKYPGDNRPRFAIDTANSANAGYPDATGLFTYAARAAAYAAANAANAADAARAAAYAAANAADAVAYASDAAYAAACAADAAACAAYAARAAAYAAANAADAVAYASDAAYAAEAAACAAYAAYAANAANAASASYDANAAANAAANADDSSIDFCELADKAVRMTK